MSYLTRNVVISSNSIPCSCLVQFSCVKLADLGYKLVVSVTRQVMYLEAGYWAYRLIRLLKLRPWTVKVQVEPHCSYKLGCHTFWVFNFFVTQLLYVASDLGSCVTLTTDCCLLLQKMWSIDSLNKLKVLERLNKCSKESVGTHMKSCKFVYMRVLRKSFIELQKYNPN